MAGADYGCGQPTKTSIWIIQVCHDYTRASLLAVTRAAGFEPVTVGYFNTLLFPLIVARRTLGRLFGLVGDDDAMPSLWLNRLLGAVFALERRLVGRVRLPFGVSLLMLARKPG